jgi:cell division septum initiation protein DivIVA
MTSKWMKEREETEKRAAKFNGGFSKEITQCRRFIDYAGNSHGPFGYIGASYRTKVKDRIVEKLLIATGLGPDGIVDWLTSTDGRHMMDSVYKDTKVKEFEEIARESTKDAFIRVTLWSHPDYSIRNAKKLRQLILESLNDKAAEIIERSKKTRENVTQTRKDGKKIKEEHDRAKKNYEKARDKHDKDKK